MNGIAASPLKRRRRTNAGLQALDDLIFEVVERDQPMTVRQVFYRLSVLGGAAKDETGHEAVQRRLVKLRRDRVIPHRWITDSTRWQRKPDTFTGLQHALRETARFYRRSLWAEQPHSVEIWCEKDALAGVIYDVASEYDVPLMVNRSYPIITYLQEAGETIQKNGKFTYIYYFGDYDPSGVDIPRKVYAGLREAVGGAVPIMFTRAAVTPWQIEERNLPTRRPSRVTAARSASRAVASSWTPFRPPRCAASCATASRCTSSRRTSSRFARPRHRRPNCCGAGPRR